MSTNSQTIVDVRKTAIGEHREDVNLHPARGILLAVFLSALFWTAVVAAFLIA
jgi:hypothetical protein